MWHGLSNKEGEKKLHIFIDANDIFLICMITDNGIGRTKAAEIKSKNTQAYTSKGIDITSRRLALISNENEVPVSILDLYDEAGNAAGTSVTVKIPRQSAA